MSIKLEEDKDREVRKNNIIFYRVPENCSDSLEVRKTADTQFVKEMCEVVFGVSVNEDDIRKQYRLGKFQDNGRVRPILISFNDAEKKERIMQNLRNLNLYGTKFKSIGIAHDLTPRQRQTAQELRDEAVRKYAENDATDKENFKFLVVGAHNKQKVIKVRK